MADEIDFENGRISNFQCHVTLTLTLDQAIWLAYHCASLINPYLRTKCHWDRTKKFRRSHLNLLPSSKSSDTKTRI